MKHQWKQVFLWAVMGCGPDPVPITDGGGVTCMPGYTETCACDSRTQGMRTCNSDGTGYGACMSCMISRPQCVGRECGPDGAGGTCGNGCLQGYTCNSSGRCEADCASASGDCDQCTSRSGCGWCNSTRTCVLTTATCSGPASGTCSSGWTCSSSQCHAVTSECSPCTSDAQCPGSSCQIRFCDGRRACAPSGSVSTCLTVGGVACPPRASYHSCTDHTQCGNGRSLCYFPVVGTFQNFCSPPCTSSSDCPQGPDSTTNAYCYMGRCMMSCMPGMTAMCTSDGQTSCHRVGTSSLSLCF